jgi:hypothetical protein
MKTRPTNPELCKWLVKKVGPWHCHIIVLQTKSYDYIAVHFPMNNRLRREKNPV